MIYNKNDLYIGKSFEAYGEFSELEIDYLKNFISPGDYILDIGANIGSHSVAFANFVGPKGAVFSFEPQRIVFQTLCGNLALNSITNVFAFRMVMTDKTGSTRIPFPDYLKESNFGGLSADQYNQGEFTQTLTVDQFAIPKCSFIKIDVEGMEAKVLRGAQKTIRKFRPVLYVENDRQEKSVELVSLINSMDYEIYWHKPPLFNPDNFLNNQENIFGQTASINLLCLPKEKNIKVEGLSKLTVAG